jgi:ATP-binding cassette, subfamily B, multidrug efflux pump
MRDLCKLFSFLRPYWLFVVIAPLLMVCEVGLDLLQPRFVQHIIDVGVAQSDISVVLRTGALMAGVSVVAMLCGAGCTWFAVRAAYRMGGDIRGAVFQKIQGFSFANLDKLETGSLITRLTSDVNQVQEMVAMMMRGMVRMPLLLIGSVVMAVSINRTLGLVFFVVLPLLVLALVLIIRASFPLYRKVQTKLDGLNTVLQENLSGVRVVKAFARGPHESSRFARVNNALVKATTAAVRTGALTTPVMMLTLNAGIVAALWIGGKQVYLGGMKVGEVVAFINYLMQALHALMMFSNLIVQVSRAQASARRVGELLRTRPALKPAAASAAPVIPRPRGRIVFDNVTFGYGGPGHDPEIKDISFTAEPGQTVAILGATGSGKSSLVQLIPRFYDATAGRVTLDGVDVRDIPEPELRRLVGIALQESVLFSNTIRANLALGKPDASESEIVEAARIAQADDFIRRFPEGYDTVVGQRGVNLSGGQKQRLAIARALLPRPAVLILDDSTSAVDLATEARIQEGLASVAAGQTRIIVAQRISSVVHADRILVLDDGRLVGDGTHSELLVSCPVYREIHESQTETGVLVHGGE